MHIVCIYTRTGIMRPLIAPMKVSPCVSQGSKSLQLCCLRLVQ